MDVSVIIVNYNTVELTKQCILSIYAQTEGVNFEIIVVDNNSVDNSVNIIYDNFPQVTLISNEDNIGFGRANNLGVKIAKGKYIFFLNSDTILLNNAIKIFFDYIEKKNINSKIGALGSVMLDSNLNLNYRNSYYEFPKLNMFFNIFFKDFFSDSKKKYLNDTLKLKNEGQISVDFIVGADLFVPRVVIDNIGSFDPDYFLYWEEVDLQYRMYKKKLSRLIIFGPEIVHLEGGSSEKKVKNWQRKIEKQSLLLYFRKNSSFFSFFLVKVILVVFVIKSIIFRKYSIQEQKEYIKLIIKT
jgi:GT2 family glycosyltransferase